MKFSNFKLTEVIGDGPTTWKFRATVSVTTRSFFFWKKTEERELFNHYADNWIFVETGELVGSGIYQIVASFEAKNGKNIQYCPINNSKE